MTYLLSSVTLIPTNLCCDSLIYPLKCVFEGALQEDKYPDCWKKALFIKMKVKSGKKL